VPRPPLSPSIAKFMFCVVYNGFVIVNMFVMMCYHVFGDLLPCVLKIVQHVFADVFHLFYDVFTLLLCVVYYVVHYVHNVLMMFYQVFYVCLQYVCDVLPCFVDSYS
jgi:phage-related protein